MKRLGISLALLAVTAFAQGPGPRHGQGFGPGGPGGPIGPDTAAALKESLGLNDSQLLQLKELRKQEFSANKGNAEAMREKSKALHQEMRAATPDSAKVGELTLELKKMREGLKADRVAWSAKAANVLTPDQKAKLATLENAQKLMPSVHAAQSLGLLAPPEMPEGAAAMGGPGPRPMRRGAPPAPAQQQQ